MRTAGPLLIVFMPLIDTYVAEQLLALLTFVRLHHNIGTNNALPVIVKMTHVVLFRDEELLEVRVRTRNFASEIECLLETLYRNLS